MVGSCLPVQWPCARGDLQWTSSPTTGRSWDRYNSPTSSCCTVEKTKKEAKWRINRWRIWWVVWRRRVVRVWLNFFTFVGTYRSNAWCIIVYFEKWLIMQNYFLNNEIETNVDLLYTCRYSIRCIFTYKWVKRFVIEKSPY